MKLPIPRDRVELRPVGGEPRPVVGRSASRMRMAFSVVGWSALAVFTIWRLSTLVVRATYPMQISLNEGWNAYHARAAAEGVLLYGSAPGATSYRFRSASCLRLALAST